MKIFRKNKNTELHPFIMRLLTSVNQKLLQYANYLQRITNHYSRSKRQFILCLFCFVFVTESIVIVIHGLQKTNVNLYTVVPIRFMPPPGDPGMHPGFSESEIKRIEQFKHYLDSNQIFRDSLLATRPHLIDTLNYLQKIYTKNGK